MQYKRESKQPPQRSKRVIPPKTDEVSVPARPQRAANTSPKVRPSVRMQQSRQSARDDERDAILDLYEPLDHEKRELERRKKSKKPSKLQQEAPHHLKEIKNSLISLLKGATSLALLVYEAAIKARKHYFDPLQRNIKLAITGGVIVLVALVGLISATQNWRDSNRSNASEGEVAGSVDENDQAPAQPNFEVINPSNTGEVRFDEEKQVASFEAALQNQTIVVSQQKLTSTQQEDPTAFLNDVAGNTSLTQELDTDKGPAFIGSNSQEGLQYVAFISSDLLILIQSRAIFEDQTWVNYINQF